MADTPMKQLLEMIAESKAETTVLASLVGRLVAELSLLTPDPQAKLDRILSSTQGIIAAVVSSTSDEYTGTSAMTKIVERISSSAEEAMRSARQNNGEIV